MKTEAKFVKTPEFAIAIAFFSLLMCTVLTVLGVRLKNLSWLFLPAWIFAVPTTYIFCMRLKRRSFRIGVSAVVLIAIALGLYFLDTHTRPLNVAPVEISPDHVTFTKVTIKGGSDKMPTHFLQQYTFRITNTTDRDVYDIGARLLINSKKLSVDDFDLAIPKSSRKALDDGAPVGARTGDMMAAGFRSKQTNASYFVVMLQHLEPHESREIEMDETASENGNRDEVVVTGSIYHSTFEPDATLTNSSGALFMPKVPFPEAGTIEKLILLPHVP